MTFPILGGNTAVAGGYTIDNSLRFNDGDSPELSKTLGSPTNNKIYTFSMWLKRGVIDTSTTFIGHYDGSASNPFVTVQFQSSGTLRVEAYDNDTTSVMALNTGTSGQLFRDVSAWYHIVLAFDTTQSTASNRVKVYVNGNQVTSFGTETYPSQNKVLAFNKENTEAYYGVYKYGNSGSGGNFYDGYIAELFFIDGQQLSPTDFGEFDEDSGIWKPKEYEGTFGNNGYFLDFENSGSLGADSSGNGNNFTPTNLASTDQTTDTPTNNFCTLNSIYINGASSNIAPTYSEGNTITNSGGSGTSATRTSSTFEFSSGKWYWEVKVNDSPSAVDIGINNNTIGALCGIRQDGTYFTDNNNQGTLTSFTSGDIISFAFDMDNKKMYIAKNGTYMNSANPSTSTNGISFTTTDSMHCQFKSRQDDSLSANFGNPPFSITSGNSDGNGYGNFEYTPPSGYLALCTQNLATALSPTIDDGSAYFHTQLYTGNGSARTITNDANAGDFQPDWVWVKHRNHPTAHSHNLVDSSRGGTKTLYSSNNGYEETITQGITGFATDGFTVGTNVAVNSDTINYVAWQWRANGGTTSSNTDGTITSTVQANQTAGFSIVTWTGTGANATVGHGLGKTPKVVIVKNRSDSDNWTVYNNNLSDSKALFLQDTNAEIPTSSYNFWSLYWNETDPTSSVFSVGVDNSVNGSSDNIIAYCFAEIEGYSKYGTYTGNGTGSFGPFANGTFVYTGFKPAWVMIKRTDGANGWNIFDNKRNPFNIVEKQLFANSTAPEDSDASHHAERDYLSNGFKLKGNGNDINANGATYSYYAIAENPFVTSSGVPVTAR